MRGDKEALIGSKPFYISTGVHARLLWRTNGRVELAVIIDDNLSAEELRSAWSEIDHLRTRLRRFQGSDMHGLTHAVLYRYSEMKADGWSYNLIAMEINHDCIVNLCRAIDELPDPNAPVLISESLSAAILLLRTMRLKDKDILDIVQTGLDEIRQGNAPWPIDSGPVDSQRVRDALRQWNREQSSEKIIVKSPPKYKIVSSEELFAKNQNSIEKADSLLRKSYPRSLLKFENRIREMLMRQPNMKTETNS